MTSSDPETFKFSDKNKQTNNNSRIASFHVSWRDLVWDDCISYANVFYLMSVTSVSRAIRIICYIFLTFAPNMIVYVFFSAKNKENNVYLCKTYFFLL